MIGSLIGLGLGYFGLLVFALLAFSAEIGFRVGRARARSAASLEKETTRVSTVVTAMLAFVASTLAVTTGIAENRFEARRLATRDEANSIGTAWLRTGLPGAARKPIAALIEEYARVRLAYVAAAAPDAAAAPLAAVLVSSISDMLSASLVQRYAVESRTPNETFLGLQLGAMFAAGALGYQMELAARRQLVLTLLLLLMLSGGLVMIVDFNRPYGGFIRVNPAPFEWTIRGFAGPPH